MIIHYPDNQKNRNPLFSRLTVAETMRKRVIALSTRHSIGDAVRTFIKYKVNAVLIKQSDNQPIGVVTKTEVMGAYYASLPLETPLTDIMGTPVIHCSPAETLESALLTMQQAGIHRIYAIDDDQQTVGTLAYPDIVGKLYKYCCNCDFSLHKKTGPEAPLRHTVGDVMRPGIETAPQESTIMEVIEKLSAFHFGALLLVDEKNAPAGVISKTDLALAYYRGVTTEQSGAVIMKTPVEICRKNLALEEGIRHMILKEISRLFIKGINDNSISGVLSLSDAARARSGSCQACSGSRIHVGK
jgi:CBS domain-containing protein